MTIETRIFAGRDWNCANGSCSLHASGHPFLVPKKAFGRPTNNFQTKLGNSTGDDADDAGAADDDDDDDDDGSGR